MWQGGEQPGVDLWSSLHLTELAYGRGTMNVEITISRTKHETCVQLGFSHAQS